MAEIYDANENFDFTKINFLKPIPSIGGNYFIRMRINSTPLYIQPPKSKIKQGIIKTGKKYYTDLVFTNENDSFIQWMENLESKCQNIIYENRAIWFDGGLDKHDIEIHFTSPLKSYKSGKFYNLRCNITSEDGEPMLKIYDENENIVELDTVDDKLDAITVLEIQGIRCFAKSFQIEIELKQMMILAPKDIFNKCVLKPTHSVGSMASLIENHSNIDTPIQNEDLENTEIIKNSEKRTLQTEITEKEEEIEEFDVHLEDLSNNEIVQIRNRNDVYYEMYKEAKRKAKIARDLALSSYLEAKRIKNTYMLDDLKDSDESDLDAEEDPQDLE
jgi:hypothetical protein